MESKQTAVEWLKEQIECFGNKHELQMSWSTLDELLEQAKEKEKEQIIEAWIVSDNPLQRMEAEKYYNITYKQD
jgi:hypothetical protein